MGGPKHVALLGLLGLFLLLCQPAAAKQRPVLVNYFAYFDAARPEASAHWLQYMMLLINQTTALFGSSGSTSYSLLLLQRQANGSHLANAHPLTAHPNSIKLAVAGVGRQPDFSQSTTQTVNLMSAVQTIQEKLFKVAVDRKPPVRRYTDPKMFIFGLFPPQFASLADKLPVVQFLGHACRKPLVLANILPAEAGADCDPSDGTRKVFHEFLLSDYLKTELDNCASDALTLNHTYARLQRTFAAHERYMAQCFGAANGGRQFRPPKVNVQITRHHDGRNDRGNAGECRQDLLVCHPWIFPLAVTLAALTSCCGLCGFLCSLYFSTGRSYGWAMVLFSRRYTGNPGADDDVDYTMAQHGGCNADPGSYTAVAFAPKHANLFGL